MDAATVRAWAAAAARALDRARGPIDSLNVFPVPDGDTGTNLALTVAEGAEHLTDAGPGPDADAAEVASAFARGALLGARGNSGVIVSQYLHGFAAGLAAADGAPGTVVAAALDQAQRAARAAVARPVEGTILTAATAASDAAAAVAQAGGDAEATTAAAAGGAREALARSPQTLDVLRAAGVVDAGASGLVVLLEALAAVVRGSGTATGEITRVVPRRTAGADPTGHVTDDGEFEVMLVVEPDPAGAPGQDLAPALSARMEALGGSVAVVGGADGWHVHVHTDRPADAVTAGLDVGGTQSQVVVRQLASPVADGKELGVVAGTGAPGLVADLARSGALVMVLTGWPVGPRDVLRAVVDTGAPHVVVLPGSPPALVAARAAAALADVRVDVLDATDDARVVAAVTADAARPADRPADRAADRAADQSADQSAEQSADQSADRVEAMRSTLGAVRTAVVPLPDVAQVLAAVHRLLLDGGELVTVVAGRALVQAAAADRWSEDLSDALDAAHPGVELVVLAGGQAEPAAVVAVE